MSHRTRSWAHFALTLIVVILSVSVVFAQDAKPAAVGLRPDAPTYAVHGPYWVGTRQFLIKDPERPMHIRVWYPALNSEGVAEDIIYNVDTGPDFPPMTIHGHAIADAAPDTQQAYPLVVYSPGGGAAPEHHIFLPEHLASYGFVVIGGQHPGNDTQLFMASFTSDEGAAIYEDQMLLSEVYRLIDIHREIDYAATLSASGDFKGMIDLEQVAVAGVSFGGYVALASGGARLDFANLKSWLQKNTPVDPFVLKYPENEQRLAALLDKDIVLGELWPSIGDPRVDAVIPMAPGDIPLFGEKGLKAMTLPALIMTGSADELAPQNAFWAYEGIGSTQKSLVTLENGGHSIYNFECEDWAYEMGMWSFCIDSVWDKPRAQDLMNHFATAFLLDILKGDKEAAKALAPDAVSFPGITYKAKGF